MKALNIDYYCDGYDSLASSCHDNPIAAAAGHFHHDFYFYYMFYYCMLKNWPDNEEKSDIDFWNVLLGKIGCGLKIEETTSNTPDEFYRLVESNIRSGRPTILFAYYRDISFLHTYMDESDKAYDDIHACIISEYDEKKQTFGLRDYLLSRDFSHKYMTGEPFIRIYLQYQNVYEIWHNSNQRFCRNDLPFKNIIISVERMAECNIIGYYDLLMDFKDNFSKRRGFLNTLIDENKINEINDKAALSDIRLRCYTTMFILLDIIKKALLIDEQDQQFINFKKEYLKNREFALSKIITTALRKKILTEKEKHELLNRIDTWDTNLIVYINKQTNSIALDKI